MPSIQPHATPPHTPYPHPPPPTPALAGFLDRIKQAYQRNPELPNLLVDPEFAKDLSERCDPPPPWLAHLPGPVQAALWRTPCMPKHSHADRISTCFVATTVISLGQPG